MYSARGITNEVGDRVSLTDVQQVEIGADNKIAEVIEWSKSEECDLSVLTRSNTFSMLARFILENHKGSEYRSACISSTSRKSNYRRIQIDGFEYIERKSVITRRKVKS